MSCMLKWDPMSRDEHAGARLHVRICLRTLPVEGQKKKTPAKPPYT